MGSEFGRRRSPRAMMRSLRADIAEMWTNVKCIEADLDTFGDLKKLKAWLKDYRIVANDPGYGERWF